MAQPSIHRNTHPVDRLADLREVVREAEAEIESIRATLLANRDLVGDRHIARITSQDRNVLSRYKLEKRFGAKAVAECCEKKTAVMVRVDRRA